MARMVMELTNRCNLRCQHCFTERHAATGELPLAMIEKVLQEGKDCGIDHLVLHGGEPTLHRQFPELVRRVCEAGYTFSFVSNGVTFPQHLPAAPAPPPVVHGRDLQPRRGPRGDA